MCVEEGNGKGGKCDGNGDGNKRAMEIVARVLVRKATKRVRARVARGMGTATKRARGRASRAMAMATRVVGN